MPPWTPTLDSQGRPLLTREAVTWWSNHPEITEWVECLGCTTGTPQLLPITYIEDTHQILGNLSEFAKAFPTPKQRESTSEVEDEWDPPLERW